MQQNIVNESMLAEIVESVWQTVLELPIQAEVSPESEPVTPDLSVCVHIAGAWHGAVLFWPTDRFARRAAAILFAIPEESVEFSDIQDGMAELANMVAGNVKSVLPGPSALSLPTVTRGPEHEVFVRRTRLAAQLHFTSAGESLSIRLLEGLESPCNLASA